MVPSPVVRCWVRGRIFCRPHSDICLIVIMMDVTSVSLARSLQVGRGVAAQPDRVSPNSSDELGAVGGTLTLTLTLCALALAACILCWMSGTGTELPAFRTRVYTGRVCAPRVHAITRRECLLLHA